MGNWVDTVTGFSGYALVFIAFALTFDSFWLRIAGVVLLGFYSLRFILGQNFHAIAKIKDKKDKLIKNKRWYLKIFGVTFIPPVLIVTSLFGRPEITIYFFAIGYVGYVLMMIFLQFRYMRKRSK